MIHLTGFARPLLGTLSGDLALMRTKMTNPYSLSSGQTPSTLRTRKCTVET